MSSIRDSRPFSLIVNQNLDKANGMTFEKSIGELVDDSFDANGDQYIVSLQTYTYDEKTKQKTLGDKHLIFFNDGENLSELSLLRGLSEKVTGKPQDKIGLMNHGYLASEGFLEPDEVMNISRNEAGVPITLTFESGKYYKAIKNSRENYADPSLLPQKFMTQETLSIVTLPKLKAIFEGVKNSAIKQRLLGTLETRPGNGTSQFLLNLFTFKQGHKFYNVIDEEIRKTLPNFNLYHGKILQKKQRKIHCELSNGAQNVLSRETAKDVHAGAKKLHFHVDVFVGASPNKEEKDELVLLQISLSMEGFKEKETFWITNKPTDNKFKGTQPLFLEPPVLKEKKLPFLGSFEGSLSVLSKNEAREQAGSYGGDFAHVDNLRGVFLSWNDRYLGRPWWDDDWGASRNAGDLRCDIRIENNRALIQKLFNIQTDKSKMNCSGSHPVTNRLFKHLMKNTIKCIFGSTAKAPEEKNNPNFKYEQSWNPHQLYSVIKTGELPPVVAAQRKVLVKGSVAPPVVVPATPQPASRPTTPPTPPPTDVRTLLGAKTTSVTPNPIVSPPPSKIKVEAHQRSPSKSFKELCQETIDFADALMSSSIADVVESASNEAKKGIVEHITNLQNLKKFLKENGVVFQD
jgi:hypothetical protein